MQIKELKDDLLKKFEKEIISNKEITQLDLENAVRKQQGGYDECKYNNAKSLINLLWEHYPNELVKIYRLVPTEGTSIEIEKTIKEAHNLNI